MFSTLSFSMGKIFKKSKKGVKEILDFCYEFKQIVLSKEYDNIEEYYSAKFIEKHGKDNIKDQKFYNLRSLLPDDLLGGKFKKKLIILKSAKFKITNIEVESSAEIQLIRNGEDKDLNTLRKLFLNKDDEDDGHWVINDWVIKEIIK